MDAGEAGAHAASSNEPSDLLLMLRLGASPAPATSDRLEDEITAIRVKANGIAAQMKQLQRENDALQEGIQRRESLLRAPIRRLPAELLTEVFLYVFGGRRRRSPPSVPVLRRVRAPAPGGVRYHFALLECAQLSIAIKLSWAGSAASTVVRRASRYLRGVIHPSLVFYTPHNGNSPPRWGWSDAVQPLLTYAADCEDLTFAVSWPILKRIATSWELPRLRKLFLNINKCYVTEEDRHYEYAWELYTRCRFFGRSPALTHLTIRGFRSGFGMGLPFVLPWKQLTELTLFGGMPLVYQEFLQHCTALQVIHFYPGDNDGFADRRLVVCLPHLWKLAVVLPHPTRTCRHYTNASWFLDTLDAPSLTDLTVSFVQGPPLLSLIKRSRCDLASLSLTCNSTEGTVGIEEISELVGLAPKPIFPQYRIRPCVPEPSSFVVDRVKTGL